MQDILSVWWVWTASALALAILEVLVPGFVFLGFAIGAAGVGLVVGFGLLSLSWPLLLVIWAGLSLAAWLVMRQIFALPERQVKRFDHDVND